MSQHIHGRFNRALLHPKHWVSWLGALVLIVIAYLPQSLRMRLSEWFGRRQYKKQQINSGKRYQIVSANLAVAFPDKSVSEREVMVAEHFVHHYRGYIDYSLLFFRSKKWLASHVRLEGDNTLSEMVEQGRNVMILLTHSVALDFAPVALSHQYSVYGSYHTQKNAVLDWLMARSREKHVDYLIARSEGMQRLVRLLVPRRLLIFLADEDLGLKHACFAKFYREEKATLVSPIRISKLKKAVCFAAFTWFDKDSKQYVVSLGKKFEFDYTQSNEVNALLLNKRMQEVIDIAPLQYMWMLKFFKTRPEGKKSLY